MLQSITWQATDSLARSQLAVFHQAGNVARLSETERRDALRLSEQQWAAWSDFQYGGPLPAQPTLPEMLCRLGSASYHLVVAAERQGIAA